MLPERYRSTYHAIGDIWRTEGIRGYYRGFPIFLVAFSLQLIVAILAKEQLKSIPIGGEVDA